MLILFATDVYGMQIVLYKHNLQRYQPIATTVHMHNISVLNN